CDEYFQPCMQAMNGYRDMPDPVKASRDAHLVCPSCQGVITSDLKDELNKKGIWLREGEHSDPNGGITGTPRQSRIASFWMEGPAAGYQTWAQMIFRLLTAEQEFEATGSEETLKAVTNTDCGIPYLPRSSVEQRQSETLMIRAEDVTKRTVPDGVHFLIATVDVQGGKNRRFVVQVIGYGTQGERWIVDRYNIKQSMRVGPNGESLPIDPAGYLEDWDLLRSDVLDKEWPLHSNPNVSLPVLAMAVDSGGEDGVTGNAYGFWRQCRRDGVHKRVFLFKGDSTTRSKLITKALPDNTDRPNRRAEAGGVVPLYLLQTNQLKDRISNALQRETPGANYVHFPAWLGEWFYDELTYEERGSDGKWTKPGKGANEAFDLMVYAHALVILKGYEKINWEKPPPWARPIDAHSSLSPVQKPPSPTSRTKTPKPKKPLAPQEEKTSAWAPSTSGGWV
ncbi:TPA: terminase gpA endonuclease subunit, partial [Yersinia enterocolitica]